MWNFTLLIIIIIITRTGSNMTPTHLKHEELLYVNSEHFITIDRSKYSIRTSACLFGKSVNISSTATEQFQKNKIFYWHMTKSMQRDLHSKYMIKQHLNAWTWINAGKLVYKDMFKPLRLLRRRGWGGSYQICWLDIVRNSQKNLSCVSTFSYLST